MTDSKNNILIICWDFPPKRAIGGRRWAKFAKYLLKLDYNISVISNWPKNKQTIQWIDAESYSKIKAYNCKENILVRWLNDYSSIVKTIKLRVAKNLLKFLFKGTIYDRAVGVENRMLHVMEKVVTNDRIGTIIVTGAPFNLFYYAAELKKKHRDLKLICDYRDPWTEAQNYGMKQLSKGRKEFELHKQNIVFENADIITAPNGFLLNEIKNTYSGTSSKIAKFIELQHAFDPDDVVKFKSGTKHSKAINLTYGGALYIGCEPYLQLLNESIDYLKRIQSEALVKVNIYTNDIAKKNVFKRNEDCVHVNHSIGDGIFEEINGSDFILIILAEHNKNYVTSKFYEFLPYKKPYIYIGPMGYVSEKIENEKLGFVLRNESDLYQVIKDFPNSGHLTNVSIDSNSFESVLKSFVTKAEI